GWSPDEQDGLKGVPGSQRLTSSKTMSNMIADVFFVKQRYLETHREELRALVEGWLRGAAEINTDPAAKEQAVQILANGLNQPLDFIRAVIDNARLVTYGDNVNFFIDTQLAPTAKTAGGARIRIEGNTDNVGSPDMNQSLSERRAQAVADYLVSKYGFDSHRFIVVGNGARKPVASNDSDSGRA